MPAIRALDASDAELIYRHRFEMFRAMGRDESDLALLMAASYAEFKRRGIAFAVLHASAAGRPLYERDGWTATTEMAKALGG